ncbi:MAG TPA: hypothetical protein VK664_07185 [Flavitalea sp.]|nr:hypothetical protein [Flavitalea sp.]
MQAKNKKNGDRNEPDPNKPDRNEPDHIDPDRNEPDRNEEDEKFPLPVYESGDDIYNRGKELPLDELDNSGNARKSNNNKTHGSDLDIPGSELDDANESIGEEDEENNYYSLGGENHENLEEGNADQ